MRFADLPQTWQKALGGKGEVPVWLEFVVGNQSTDRVADVSGLHAGCSVGTDWNRRVSFGEAVVELYRDDDLLPDTAGSMFHDATGKVIESVPAGATSVKILAESISFAPGQKLTLAGGGKSEEVTVASFTAGTLYHTVGLSAGTGNAYPVNSTISTLSLLGAEAMLRLRAQDEDSWLSLYRGVIVARPEVSAERIYVKLGGKWETAFRAPARLLDPEQKFLTIDGAGKAVSSVQVTCGAGWLDVEKVQQKSGGRHGSWRLKFSSASEYTIAGPSTVLRGQKFYLPRPATVATKTGRTGARSVAHYQNYVYIVENTTSTSGRVGVFKLNDDGSLTWVRDLTDGFIARDDLWCCYVAGNELHVIQKYHEEWVCGHAYRYRLTDPANPTYLGRTNPCPLEEFYGACDANGFHVAIIHSSSGPELLWDIWNRKYGPQEGGMQGMIRRLGAYLYVGHSAYIKVRSWTWPCNLVRSIAVTGGTWDWDFAGDIGYCTSPGSNRVLAVDLTNPASATVIGEVSEGLSTPRGLAVFGPFLLVASSANNKVVAYDISDPTSMTLVASFDLPGTPYDVHTAGDYAIAVATGGTVLTFALAGGTEFDDETLTLPPAALKGSWASGAEVSFVTSRVWESANVVRILRDVVLRAGVDGKMLDVSSYWSDLELGTLSAAAASGATKISVKVDRWWRVPQSDTVVVGAEEVTVSADCFSLPPVMEISISALGQDHDAGESVKWKQRTSPWTSASWDRAYQYAELSRLRVSTSVESERTYDDIISDVLRHANMAMAEDGFGVVRLWPWGPARTDAEEISGDNVVAMSEDTESVPVVNAWRASWAKAPGGNQWESEVTTTPGPEKESVDFGAFYSELPVSCELERRAAIFRGARVKRAECTFARCYLAPGDFVSGRISGVVTRVSLSPRLGKAELEIWEVLDVERYAYAGDAGAGYRRTW